MGIFSTKRAKAITGGIVGVGIAGGAALAAILLTTTIEGNASVSSETIARSVEVTGSGKGTNLDCSDIKVSTDSGTVTVNPKLIIQNGQGGTCTLKAKLNNTGDQPLTITKFDLQGPAGWTIAPAVGTAVGQSIPAGQSGQAEAVVTATGTAQGGAVTGTFQVSGGSTPTAGSPLAPANGGAKG
ncbi:NEW3 domain-containing protein [Pseudonocardia pini]|uniref:NEW3 domain-containing protein n=1 Tax=Pseudonocardia pini TaxID=2758030 RepID=UPI0015F106F8|nr:NEW3 domain-containing protein [Pseudonocardia pini]